MLKYSQAGRPILITTPLGPDRLLLAGFRGHESISQLFRFELDLLASRDNDDIRFEDIVGQGLTVQMRLVNQEIRYFNGMVKRFTQGGRDEDFTAYRAEVVPWLWVLTKKVQCRIFQDLSVPEILNQVLSGFDVTFGLSRSYYKRNYCVQYRESDFDFASRLMEEEGIYYFFVHSDGHHQMVVSDAGNAHPKVPGQSHVIYEEVGGGVRADVRVRTWEKSQEVRAAKYTLWDHCFEQPGTHLEECEPTVDKVKVGTVTHELNLVSDELEIYDYPGGFAKRFDGIDRQGNARMEQMPHMYDDGERTARIRMEEEESTGLEVAGTCDCGHFAPGFSFTLEKHFDADGDYLLTRVAHDARQTGFRTGEKDDFGYDNRFLCIPIDLTYRPRRATAKPVIASVQTATVTGPPAEDTSGQEIFCDQYGRVKVQFHWDRQGKLDGDSSCWLRVAQIWAGKGWGAFFWPRIGHEVVVAFEEGDPDQPLIVGSVYNAVNMPPYALPDSHQLGGIRSASVRGNAGQNFNGIVFDDKKGDEHLALHSEHNMSLNAELDKMFNAGRNKGERVASASIFTVGGLPSGGGSGGGPIAYVGPAAPQAGVNLAAVYGNNVAFTVGVSNTLGLGSAAQVTVDPLALLDFLRSLGSSPVLKGKAVPDWLWSTVKGLKWLYGSLKDLYGGAGLGGYAQFTVGSNTAFLLGSQYTITLTPEKDGGATVNVTKKMSEAWVIILLCLILAAVLATWAFLYGFLGSEADDTTRKDVTLAVEAAITAIQSVIVFVADKDIRFNKLWDKVKSLCVGAKEPAERELPELSKGTSE